jgi:hypothetical protein
VTPFDVSPPIFPKNRQLVPAKWRPGNRSGIRGRCSIRRVLWSLDLRGIPRNRPPFRTILRGFLKKAGDAQRDPSPAHDASARSPKLAPIAAVRCSVLVIIGHHQGYHGRTQATRIDHHYLARRIDIPPLWSAQRQVLGLADSKTSSGTRCSEVKIPKKLWHGQSYSIPTTSIELRFVVL